ncbi:MAG: signal peptidase I [Candidatus Fonsibacter ubiquis]|nr:signal peptidase I [Candidatus Fonsibacter ubiquis]
MKKIIIDNAKTLIFAFLIALFIRTFFFQPFYIPSSSMEESLLVGDRLFVTKFTYGYSKHSLPFSPNISDKRILFSSPERGDVIVFKTPEDNDTDYIKRLIGLPGDKIQMLNGVLNINNKPIKREFIKNDFVLCGGTKIGNLFTFWKWHKSIRFNRILKFIK